MNEHPSEQTAPRTDRGRVIIRTSVIGILANLLLAGFKAAMGLLSNSIALVLDAVNNLTDALSSVITIIGTRLASRKPDKKHPLGHGRYEYLTAMAVAVIVLYAGFTSLVESVKQIISPEAPDHSVESLIVIAAAVGVKLLLGRYVKRKGEQVNSGSLIASGTDALSDALLSTSVLLSAAVFLLWGFNIEAYVGVLISVFILKSGSEMLSDTMDDILGKRVDRKFLGAIKKTICEEPCVSGAFDLILHSYGPDQYVGSVHVEVPDTMTADEIDVMERRIAENVFQEHGVILAGIGIYSVNTRSDAVQSLRTDITRKIMSHEGVLQIHGFYVDSEKKTVNLDLILDFALPDREATFTQIREELQQAYPEYEFRIAMDIDI